MLQHLKFTTAGIALCAGFAAAESTAYQIELDQQSYVPTEVVTLTVNGQPGVPGVILIDTAPGPIEILGITLNVGLSEELTIVGVPPLGASGQFILPCTAPCELVDIDLYVQAVSVDPATLELNPSNSVTITSPGKYGFCSPCEECDGGVIAMTLRYLGDAEAFIEVYEEGHYQHDHDQYFAGLVTPNAIFSFQGEGNDNKLAKDTAIAIDGVEVTSFHTSCSQPIGPGSNFGPFFALEVESKNNGPICPIDPNACDECKGGVVAMTLEYQGSQEVFVEVYKEGHYQDDDDQYFGALVAPGESFSFVGEGGDNKLAKDTAIAINGVEVLDFHTSCSQPIGPGLILGDFVVTSAESKDNGLICPIDPNACDECKGGVVAMTLEYQGSQEVFVEVYKEGHYQDDDDQYFGALVAPGESFSFVGEGGDNKLAKDTAIAINGVEVLDFHTSCSQPIGPGLILGDFVVTSAESKDNGLICPIDPNACDECKGGVVAMTLEYQGSQEAFVEVYKEGHYQDDDDQYFGALVAPGESFSFVGEGGDNKLAKDTAIAINGVEVLDFHTSCSQPIGPGLILGDFVVTSAESKDNGLICPVDGTGPHNGGDDCDAGKPAALGLTYTGEGCSASNNSQDSDKATCSGGAGFAQYVHIVVFEDEDDVYFDGLVELGDEFFALASNAGKDKFKANTRVEIFSTNGALIEELLFHTSCSQPLAVGDVFGSLTLTTFVPED